MDLPKVTVEIDLMEAQSLSAAVHNDWRAAMKRVMEWREGAELGHAGDTGYNARGCEQAAVATENVAKRLWVLYEKMERAKLLATPLEMQRVESLDDRILPGDFGYDE